MELISIIRLKKTGSSVSLQTITKVTIIHIDKTGMDKIRATSLLMGCLSSFVWDRKCEIINSSKRKKSKNQNYAPQ